MIVIAALIGGMLMPAQIMAQNNRKNAKARVENRVNNKDKKMDAFKGGSKDRNFDMGGKPGKDKGFAKNNKPGKGYGYDKGYKGGKPGKKNKGFLNVLRIELQGCSINGFDYITEDDQFIGKLSFPVCEAFR